MMTEEKEYLDFSPHKFIATEAYSRGPVGDVCSPETICWSFLIFMCLILLLPAYLALM